jgi:hypothetical protein
MRAVLDWLTSHSTTRVLSACCPNIKGAWPGSKVMLCHVLSCCVVLCLSRLQLTQALSAKGLLSAALRQAQ